MKKIFLIAGLIILISCLSSCLTTLHPIFTEKDIVYDPKLVGTWFTESQGNKGQALITNLASENSVELPGKISSSKQKGYLITYSGNDDEIERYIAFLAKIGNQLYLDYYPADKKEDKKLDDFFAAHFVKMHTSYRIEFKKNGGFELSQLDESFVKKLIDEKKIRISHEVDADDNTIITASTNELQQYLLKYGDNPSAYRSEKTVFSK